MLQQYLISIDARLRLRNSTVSVKAEIAECVWLHETQLSRDAYIKESRLFMYILNNSDILFRFGRFLCVNAYFGASIHLILFFVSNQNLSV